MQPKLPSPHKGVVAIIAHSVATLRNHSHQSPKSAMLKSRKSTSPKATEGMRMPRSRPSYSSIPAKNACLRLSIALKTQGERQSELKVWQCAVCVLESCMDNLDSQLALSNKFVDNFQLQRGGKVVNDLIDL